MISEKPPRSPSEVRVYHIIVRMPSAPLMCSTFTVACPRSRPVIREVMGEKSSDSVRHVCETMRVNCAQGFGCPMTFGAALLSVTPSR